MHGKSVCATSFVHPRSKSKHCWKPSKPLTGFCATQQSTSKRQQNETRLLQIYWRKWPC